MMRDRWTVALATSVLLVAGLPGIAAAAGGGRSLVAKDCRQAYEALGFRNVGQCVSRSSQGSPAEPTAFQLSCEGLGGTYAPTGFMPGTGTTLAPACTWAVTTNDAYNGYVDSLRSLCQPGEIVSGELFNAGIDGAVIGCRPI